MAPRKKRDYSKLPQSKLRQLEKNPGERAKIPTNLLSPNYKAERVKNARLNAPVTPGSSYTNRQIGQVLGVSAVRITQVRGLLPELGPYLGQPDPLDRNAETRRELDARSRVSCARPRLRAGRTGQSDVRAER